MCGWGGVEGGGGKRVFGCGCWGYSEGWEGPNEPRGGRRKKDKLLLASFVPVSLQCSLPSGGPDPASPPHPPTPSPHPLSAIVPIPVSPDLLHSPLHMDKWLGRGPAQPGPGDPQLREEMGMIIMRRLTSGY